MFRADGAASCGARRACAADPQSPTCLSTIAAQLRHVDINYDRILAALAPPAGPDTTIAVMTYYNPMPGCRLAGLAPLAQLVLEGGGPVPAGLNDTIRNRAAQFGVEVAETAPVIGIEDLVGGTDCLHPRLRPRRHRSRIRRRRERRSRHRPPGRR